MKVEMVKCIGLNITTGVGEPKISNLRIRTLKNIGFSKIKVGRRRTGFVCLADVNLVYGIKEVSEQILSNPETLQSLSDGLSSFQAFPAPFALADLHLQHSNLTSEIATLADTMSPTYTSNFVDAIEPLPDMKYILNPSQRAPFNDILLPYELDVESYFTDVSKSPLINEMQSAGASFVSAVESIAERQSDYFLDPAFVWELYKVSLLEHALQTKCTTAFLLYAISDWTTQALLKTDDREFDVDRMLRFAIFGIIDGGMGHFWFRFLEDFWHSMGLVQALSVFFEVATDQLLYSPWWNLVFFTSLGIMERKKPEEIIQTCKNEVPKLVVISWRVWIPVQTISFAFIPLDLRVLWTLSVMVVYTAFLSSFLEGEDGDAALGSSEFQLQLLLRSSLASKRAREKSSKAIIRQLSKNIIRDRRVLSKSRARENVTRTDPVVGVSTTPGASSTRVFLNCEDREDLFLLVTHALSSQALEIVNWTVDTYGTNVRHVGTVVTGDGSPVTDKAQLEEVEKLLGMLAGDGRPVATLEKGFEELTTQREKIAEDIRQTRQEIVEQQEQILEMPKVEELATQQSSATGQVHIEALEEDEQVSVKINFENRPGILPEVAETIFDNKWDVVEASVETDGMFTSEVFVLERRPSEIDDDQKSFDTEDINTLQSDLMEVIECSTSIENEVVIEPLQKVIEIPLLADPTIQI